MIRLEDVLKMSWRRFCKTSWRRLENVLKTSWRRIAKTNILVLTKTSWRRLEDVFWRRKAKANIFVLIKTSSEDEDERRVQDVFIKTNVCWVIFTITVYSKPYRHFIFIFSCQNVIYTIAGIASYKRFFL